MGVLTGQEADLRQSVLGDLTQSGILNKLRAELRHHVFCSLTAKAKGVAAAPKQGLQPPAQEQVILDLVHDVLVQYHLDYTAATLKSESGLGDEAKIDRAALGQRLGVEMKADCRDPLLSALLKKQAAGDRLETRAVAPVSAALDNPLTRKARRMFDATDLNKDGVISKDELRQLFKHSFAHFNEAILERYVNDEFRSSDQNFSGDLTFDEFLSLYSRIFIKIDNHDASDDGTAPSGGTTKPTAAQPTAKLGAMKNTRLASSSSVAKPQGKTSPRIKTKGALNALSDSEDDDIDDLIDSFSNEMSASRNIHATAANPMISDRGMPVALSDTAKNGPKARSFFSDTESEDEGSSLSTKSQSAVEKKTTAAAKPTETAKAKAPIDSESDLEDIEESIDDGDISTEEPSHDDDDKKTDKGIKKDDAYSNDFSDDGEDSSGTKSGTREQSSPNVDKDDDGDVDQDEIDAVSDVSVDFSDEITNNTDDKSAISADDQFDYEEDADNAF